MPEIRSQPGPTDDATKGSATPSPGSPAELPKPGLAELEARVHDLEARVRDAELELRARDEIFGAVIHDLRNPLGTIMLAATALLEPEAPADPRAQRVRNIGERVQRQAERMNQQLTNLAEFAELQSGHLTMHREPRAPAEIVAAAAAQLAPLAHERGIRFDAQAASGLPPVVCDQERVLQVFWNLVMTAIKGTPRGGAIEIGAMARGSEPVFFLRASGTAIDPEELNALFAHAQSRARSEVRPKKRSTLLGATIAHGFVEAHGGTMWADGEPGASATVCFALAPSSPLTERARSSTITDVCPPAPQS